MTKIDPYYYLDAPKNFFAENVDINDFKKNDRGIFQVEYRHISKEVREWFQDIGVTTIRGLIFRKNLIPRTNLHIDPNISGEEWVELCPKFIDKTVEYGLVWVIPSEPTITKYEPETLEAIVYKKDIASKMNPLAQLAAEKFKKLTFAR